MASLKSLVDEKLGKKTKSESKVEKPVKAPAPSSGRLKEHFTSKTAPEMITESEIRAVMEDCLPYIDKDDPKYHEYIEEAARIKRTNPSLYEKMKNWD